MNYEDFKNEELIDDSILLTKATPYSNFFILGNSLSDVNGLTSLVKDKSRNLIELDFKGEVGEANEDLSQGAYSFIEDSQKNIVFSNGQPAAYLLGKKLGFQKILPANNYHFGEDNINRRNYSVGGAMANKTGFPSGIVLDEERIYNQAKLLIKQHNIKTNDLVVLEIGGNDLINIIDEPDPKQREKLIKSCIQEIEKTIKLLFESKISKILIICPPPMQLIPRYNKLEITNPGKWQTIKNISDEFIKLELQKISELNIDNKIIVYNLNEKLTDLQEKFKAILINSGINENEIILNDAFIQRSVLNIYFNVWNQTLKVVIKSKGTKKMIDDYFFMDDVHPTRLVHEIVAQELYDLII